MLYGFGVLVGIVLFECVMLCFECFGMCFEGSLVGGLFGCND